MKRYVELDKVLDVVTDWCPDDDGSVSKTGDLRELLDEIENLPDAGVRPAVMGEWIEERFGYAQCSNCNCDTNDTDRHGFPIGRNSSTDMRPCFCPHCGADMRPNKTQI